MTPETIKTIDQIITPITWCLIIVWLVWEVWRVPPRAR